MVEFINSFTGTTMWVADEREEEYRAAGHHPVALPSEAIEPTEEPAKKTVKRTTKTKK